MSVEFNPCPNFWQGLSVIPGIGVAVNDVIDNQPATIFVNETMRSLISSGIRLGENDDVLPAAVDEETRSLSRLILRKKRPMRYVHFFRGRHIESTGFPISSNRILWVTHEVLRPSESDIPIFPTKWITLGSLAVLTNREFEVFVYLGAGLSVPDAAEHMTISVNTVQSHKSKILAKLDLGGHADIVAMVSRLGLTVAHTRLSRAD